MFHKVKNVTPISDFNLSVQFSEGVTNSRVLRLFKMTLPSSPASPWM